MTALLVLLCPAAARADAGVPMLPVAYPIILLFLVPVIAIEAVYIRGRLHTSWRNTIVATAGSNAITLLLGYPLLWILWVIPVFVAPDFLDGLRSRALLTVFTAAWPVPGYPDTWTVPIAFVLLLVPSFLLSAFVEGLLLGRFHWLRSDQPSTGTVWVANALSYCFLAATGFVLLWCTIRHEYAAHPLLRAH